MIRRRALGQNFLVNRHIAERIVESLGIEKGDLIVEVGPGRGILTGIILEKTRNLLAVELDKDLSLLLKRRFPDLKIVVFDARTFPTSNLPKDYKLISNLPYSHAGPILKNFVCGENPPKISVVMVQKEVGERITSHPGTKTYGFLTVFLSLFCEAEKLFNVSPGNFYPSPKVTSQVIMLRRKDPPLKGKELEAFLGFAKQVFSMRRKKLGTIVKKMGIRVHGTIHLEKRPEELSTDELIGIFRSISEFPRPS